MARKRVQKIPKAVKIKCPNCGEHMRVNVSLEKSVMSVDCNKCSQKIIPPITRCCVICAFSNKKCPQSLFMEARVKGLEVK